jgi:hypothetical protein
MKIYKKKKNRYALTIISKEMEYNDAKKYYFHYDFACKKVPVSLRYAKIVIYTTREEGKAFVHANCMFDDAIQVNKSGLTLEGCI